LAKAYRLKTLANGKPMDAQAETPPVVAAPPYMEARAIRPLVLQWREQLICRGEFRGASVPFFLFSCSLSIADISLNVGRDTPVKR
jgi:hypothetical protein